MKKTYSAQEIMMLISGMTILIERELSVARLVDDDGKKQIQHFISKYKTLIRKLESEV